MNVKWLFLVFIILILILIFLYLINYIIIAKKLDNENTKNIQIKDNTIKLNSMTLRQKIAQMIIVKADYMQDPRIVNLNVGGIFYSRNKSKEDFMNSISNYQNLSKVKLLVSTDMEGFWNPFENFRKFKSFSEINDDKEAYEIGLEQGIIMKEIGFNLNFAPVSEYLDKSYGGRAFNGSKAEVKLKIAGYIEGLQENVMGTCKHYPGKGMIKNLHLRKDKQNISKDDLELFNICYKNNISAIMVGHQIVNGEVDSRDRPSSVSEDVIKSIDKGNFSGLVISDEINMRGLKNFYMFDKGSLYIDLINSGENVILDFYLSPKSLYKLLLKLEEGVKEGKISEEKIDESVRKILKAKGYNIE